MSSPTPPGSGTSDLRAAVAGDAKQKKRLIIIIASVIVAALIIGITLLVVNRNSGGTDKRLSVRIATAEDNPYFDALSAAAAEDGLDIEWLNVNDWVLPNTELVAGAVDANAFQHIQYLSLFNAENNADLVPAFSTVIVQWGIFSEKFDELSELPDGARIAIPDDLSNGARALFVLQAAGLITIDPSVGLAPTIDDITSNPKNLEFVELTALTIPQQYSDPSIDAVVLGTAYFDPAAGIRIEDALYADDPTADENLPYVNVLAVNADDIDNPAWDILEKAYADPRVAESLAKESFGTQVLVQIDQQRLQDSLAEHVAFAKSSK